MKPSRFMLIFAVAGCGRLEKAPAVHLPDGGGDILVLGDSLSTGAVTHPDFALDYDGILKRAVSGDHLAAPAAFVDGAPGATPSKPVRVGKPLAEIPTFGDGGGNERAAAALLKAIEWPELSWSSHVAFHEGRSPDRVAIAARNGGMTKDAPDEVDTWLKARGDKDALPGEIYAMFSGNDLCRAEDDAEPLTPPDQFKASLLGAAQKLAAAGQAAKTGSTLYLVSHMDILQLVQNPDLQAKKRVHVVDSKGDRELSCTEFLKAYEDASAKPTASLDFDGSLLRFSYHPMRSCHSVLAHAQGLDPARAKVSLDSLKTQLEAYRTAVAQLATELPADPEFQKSGMAVKLITATQGLVMEPDDLANDCFHLSAAGQKKLAAAIKPE